MNKEELKSDINTWLNNNGYPHFRASVLNGKIEVNGEHKMDSEDINDLSKKFDIRLKECSIIYKNPFERSEIIDVKYYFSHDILDLLNKRIDAWLKKRGLYLTFTNRQYSINFYTHIELRKELVEEFESEFNVKFDYAKFKYEPSSKGCSRSMLTYSFYKIS